MRSGYPQPLFEKLYASLQQARGITKPVSLPAPSKAAGDGAVAAAEALPALHPSGHSSGSSAAHAHASADTNVVLNSVAAVSQQLSSCAASSAPVQPSAQPVNVPVAPLGDAPQPGGAIRLAHPGGEGTGWPAMQPAAHTQGLQAAPAGVGVYPSHTLPFAVPGPMASADPRVTNPQLMQLYLDQLSLERAAGVRPLGLPYGGGVPYFGGHIGGAALAAHLGGLQGSPAAVGLNPPQWSAGLGAHAYPHAGTLAGGGMLTPHGAIAPCRMAEAGMGATADACGLWPLQDAGGAAVMHQAAPGLMYGPILYGGGAGGGRVMPGHGLPLAGAGATPAMHASLQGPSAFTHMGLGFVQLSGHAPQPHLQTIHGGPHVP